MLRIDKKGLTILILLVCIIFANTITGISIEKTENKIEQFINTIEFYQVGNDEAEQSIKEHDLHISSEEGESRAITAFDVSDDGNIAIAVSTGLPSEEIQIYDKDMNLLQVISYRYQHGVNYILFEKDRVCFTGFKFHGVYVFDLKDKTTDVYKWTSDESLDILHDIIVKNNKEVVKGETRYYLSNSKKRKTRSFASDSTYRYLIAENGYNRLVLYDSGNTKLGVFMFFCFILVVSVILLSYSIVQSLRKKTRRNVTD